MQAAAESWYIVWSSSDWLISLQSGSVVARRKNEQCAVNIASGYRAVQWPLRLQPSRCRQCHQTVNQCNQQTAAVSLLSSCVRVCLTKHTTCPKYCSDTCTTSISLNAQLSFFLSLQLIIPSFQLGTFTLAGWLVGGKSCLSSVACQYVCPRAIKGLLYVLTVYPAESWAPRVRAHELPATAGYWQNGWLVGWLVRRVCQSVCLR